MKLAFSTLIGALAMLLIHSADAQAPITLDDLLLRLEETALGAAIAITTVALVLPLGLEVIEPGDELGWPVEPAMQRVGA